MTEAHLIVVLGVICLLLLINWLGKTGELKSKSFTGGLAVIGLLILIGWLLITGGLKSKSVSFSISSSTVGTVNKKKLIYIKVKYVCKIIDEYWF